MPWETCWELRTGEGSRTGGPLTAIIAPVLCCLLSPSLDRTPLTLARWSTLRGYIIKQSPICSFQGWHAAMQCSLPTTCIQSIDDLALRLHHPQPACISLARCTRPDVHNVLCLLAYTCQLHRQVKSIPVSLTTKSSLACSGRTITIKQQYAPLREL
jgi:hypothetical protein